MKRRATAALVLLLATSCVGGGSNERTILVDYSSDEFASFFLLNFPKKVEVHQGDTLVARQTWTGEPHTFTGGTRVNKAVSGLANWLDFFDAFEALMSEGARLPDPEDPGNTTVADFTKAINDAKPSPARTNIIASLRALRAGGAKVPDLEDPPDQSFAEFVAYVDKASQGGEKLPEAFTEDGIAQNAGQPCYLSTGIPPKDPKKHCTNAQQKQPEFTGKQSFYSSGIIPYQGPQGNTYRVPLSDDIKPGEYLFYCLVHGPGQRTKVVVKPKGAKIPGQGEVTREARKEIDVIAEPLQKQFREAKRTGRLTLPGGRGKVPGPFVGLIGGNHTAINEFVPKTVRTKAGQPIRWKMMGSNHTISFDVPTYFPQVQFLKNGTVRLNPKLEPPAGGAKKVPEQEGMGVFKFDGGAYDGSGFWSSGLIGAEPYLEYTMSISKRGTYRIACLIHPPMVGTVVVT
jgi:plastocyanin